MLSSFINADTEVIENKHSGKYVSNINFDVDQITRMLADAFLSIYKRAKHVCLLCFYRIGSYL
jgi:subfamily B ATP-binding cassette protein MsbA